MMCACCGCGCCTAHYYNTNIHAKPPSKAGPRDTQDLGGRPMFLLLVVGGLKKGGRTVGNMISTGMADFPVLRTHECGNHVSGVD